MAYAEFVRYELLDDLERLFDRHQQTFVRDIKNLCTSWRARSLSARGLSPNSEGAVLLQDLADIVQSLVLKQQQNSMPLGRHTFAVLRQQIEETWQTRLGICGTASAFQTKANGELGPEEPVLEAALPFAPHAPPDHGQGGESRDGRSCLQSAACIDLLTSLDELVSQNSCRAEFKSEVARVCQSWKHRHMAQSLPDNAGIVLLLKSLSDLLRTAVSSDGGREQRGRQACSNLLNALKKLFSDGLRRPGGSLASEISHVCTNWQRRERLSASSESARLVNTLADALAAEAKREASNTLAAMSYGTEEVVKQKQSL